MIPGEAKKYEEFLNQRLKTDLGKAYKRKDMLETRLRDYQETEAFIAKIENQDIDSQKTKLDLGQQFFVCAEIENLNKLVIDVGMGVFIELTYKEAKDKIFTIKMELERLLRKVDIDIIDIKTNIKMFENALSQLGQLTAAHQ